MRCKSLDPETPLTQDLILWNDGDRQAMDRIVDATYRELYKLAMIHFQKFEPGQTMQPTALVHETYLRLIAAEKTPLESRTQFYWLASKLMRHIILDYVRAKCAQKRGGSQPDISLDLDFQIPGFHSELSPEQIMDLDRNLTKLAGFDPRQSQILEMFFFGGLKIAEIGQCLNLSPATIKRDLRIAKAWLANQLCREESEASLRKASSEPGNRLRSPTPR